ncbi:unnamed protein product [Diatraea saccharalis]|uniref:Platelet-derived growth factor (PDGF) family profile domain-containing protein n=1 Tax=Diatraea saccharalis TaxID=40085 RepID=A0A9N9QYB0_9NEOP|nr:unnamed protein product [Diatraea saccharalis]
MQRFVVIFILLSVRSRTAYVTTPSFANRLDRLYEKLDKLTTTELKEETPHEKLYEKLEKLNSLTPDKVLPDDDEEVLSAMQMWGKMNADQVDGVVKDLQSVKEYRDYGKSERITDEDSDADWNDVDSTEDDYPMDWYHDEEPETTVRPAVTPSAFTRLGFDYRETVVSAVDPIAATNERPRIMDDSFLTPLEKIRLKRAAFANIAAVLKTGKCSEPQPRWLTVRQLAPAANIVYMPPCVQLHRCAPDSGCCYDEAEVCAPVAGEYIALPFYLQKADGNRSIARMQFFNHTQCACVSRETLQTTVRTRVESPKGEPSRVQDSLKSSSKERQNDWRQSTEEPSLEKEDVHTAPPQLRRCTCPTLFIARPFENGVCSCVCEWTDPARRRDCQSLARGREHFGMRDRVCIGDGDCNPPTCEFGLYDHSAGRCPLRRDRRKRNHHRTRP